MVLLLRKLYLYLTKDPEESIIFQGGCPTFSRGQMLISIRTHIRTKSCYFPGGGACPDPLSPLDQHMGNVTITGQYLSQFRF